MIIARLPDFEALHRLRGGAVVAPAEVAHFRMSGPGALACLQGLWTNDVLEPGDATITYGAFLTPKGMIIADGWALRAGETIDLILPAAAREPVAQIFRRSLPPRLATATDLSDATRVVHLLGDGAADRWPVLPLGRLPEAGKVARGETAAGEFLAGAPALGPFHAVLLGPTEVMSGVSAVLGNAGVALGGSDDREAARILAGWPAPAAEIDDRTLPQEVRFEEHGGVSYTKGCYTGQETVARLHFRGHANRVLRGLRWIGPRADGDEVLTGEKQVGRVSSVLTLPDRVLGLAVLRRELQPGARVTVGGGPAVVRQLPFSAEDVEG